MNNVLLSNYFNNDNVRVRVDARDVQDVINKAGELLLKTGKIKPDYITAISELLREAGPYMVISPGIVLLHARPESGAIAECLALMTLKTPVNFGHPDNDPVDIVFAFAAGDKNLHVQIMAELSKLLCKDGVIEKFRKARTVKSLLKIIAA